jgi:hypothetical protein
MPTDSDVAVQRLAEVFDSLGIHYFVGGSVASSVHGIPRLTADVDIVAEIRPEKVPALVAVLGDAFYADADLIDQALRDSSSFNVIHLATMVKADIFPLQPVPWMEAEMLRRQKRPIGPADDSPPVYVASAEDMILQKLRWYRLTGERSDKQWEDVLGILKVQGGATDFPYLRYWAPELEVGDLLNRALADAGFPGDIPETL